MTTFLTVVTIAYIAMGLYAIALALRFRNTLCEGCGKRDKTVHKRLDPFMLDVHNKEEEVTWCDACEYATGLEI